MVHLQHPKLPFRWAICAAPLDAENTAGEDLSGVDCQKCLDTLDAWAERPSFVKRLLEGFANFGELSYGYVDWVTLAMVTLGLGVPIVWLCKRAARGILRLKGLRSS